MPVNPYLVLRDKFPEEEYVLIAEVPDNVGQRNRYLDFMIINLWSSRGLSITGIERKSNRGDWLSEKKNPAKQESHFKYCEYFYLLTDKEGVAKLEEIPDTWGWYHITEKGTLKTMKPAPKLKSEPVTRPLLCAMLRRAQDKKGFIHKDTIADQVEIRAAAIAESNKTNLERTAQYYTDLKTRVEEFEKFSGIQIRHSYNSNIKNIGTALSIIMRVGLDNFINNIEQLGNRFTSINEGLQKDIQTLKEYKNEQDNLSNSGD